MNTERELHKYTIEFTQTIEVEAEDAVDAVEKTRAQASLDDSYIYVDGNLY